MVDIDIGVFALMAGPLVAIVCCTACLRLFFNFMNQHLRDKTDDDDATKSNMAVQQQRGRKPKRTQTPPIDLEKMSDYEKKGEDRIRTTTIGTQAREVSIDIA